MREQSRDPQRLKDIYSSILSIEQYTDGISFDQLQNDPMRYHAVVYNIMILGEAANMLTYEFREAHPQTPWKQIVGMRNFLIHGYFTVEKNDVWNVITGDLPPLRRQIEQYLNELTN